MINTEQQTTGQPLHSIIPPSPTHLVLGLLTKLQTLPYYGLVTVSRPSHNPQPLLHFSQPKHPTSLPLHQCRTTPAAM